MEDQVVNKEHPYWRAVYIRLNDDLVKYDCDHTLKITRRILTSLPNVDVEGTLEFFEDWGGYCDCEIFHNVYSNEPILKKGR